MRQHRPSFVFWRESVPDGSEPRSHFGYAWRLGAVDRGGASQSCWVAPTLQATCLLFGTLATSPRTLGWPGRASGLGRPMMSQAAIGGCLGE
jgi:hypothetical protein